MWSANEVLELLNGMGVTHVTGVPDSTTGLWFDAVRESDSIRLIPVCREGEAWGVAAGLFLGGARPLVMMQCTGLFESGDALRNAIHDFGLPIYALIGWCLLQLASIFFPRWGFPDWSLTLVLTAVVLGFPVVVAMSWVFDITPRGVRRDTPSMVAPGSKRRLVDLMVILLVLLTLSLLFWDVG